jgi:hypothetical protein
MQSLINRLFGGGHKATVNDRKQTVIEGLHIDVTSVELKEHIADRAAHHKKRAEWYAQQAQQLETGHLRTADMDRHSRSYDPLDGLLAKRNEHVSKAAYFQFICDHLVPNETYRLKEDDLARLEVLQVLLNIIGQQCTSPHRQRNRRRQIQPHGHRHADMIGRFRDNTAKEC